MRVFYFLDHPFREAERFVAREIREVMRQGYPVRIAFRQGDSYRVEGAGSFLDPAARSEGERPGTPGRSVAPLSLPRAAAASLATPPGGILRARRHARGPGRGLGSGVRQALSLASEARRFGSEILHAHFAARACEDAMLTSWLSGIPFSFTAHGYDVHREPPPDYPERAAAAAAVITVSEWNARVLREDLGVPPGKIRVIPMGVDTERFRPGGEEEPGLLASVMRLHPDKGPDLLLEAAARLLRRDVAFRLEILGEGGMRRELERRLEGPLADRVILLGRVDEETVLKTLRRAAVYVLPSRTESLGVALMEAMACARPVVATRVGGVPEVVGEEGCALLVPAGNPEALAGAVAGLLGDAEGRRSMGAAARRRVEERFRLEESVAQLRKAWREAVTGGA